MLAVVWMFVVPPNKFNLLKSQPQTWWYSGVGPWDASGGGTPVDGIRAFMKETPGHPSSLLPRTAQREDGRQWGRNPHQAQNLPASWSWLSSARTARNGWFFFYTTQEGQMCFHFPNASIVFGCNMNRWESEDSPLLPEITHQGQQEPPSTLLSAVTRIGKPPCHQNSSFMVSDLPTMRPWNIFRNQLIRFVGHPGPYSPLSFRPSFLPWLDSLFLGLYLITGNCLVYGRSLPGH